MFAMVFPGQGSQSVGMLAELGAEYPCVVDTFSRASEILGYDLWRVAQEGPDSELNRTVVTQPVMLTAGVAVWRAWQQVSGPEPDYLAGHSLGEYTALVCTGALEFGAAVALVADRARFMQEAVPIGEGAVAAVLGLDDEKVAGACAAAAGDEVVSTANFNAPGQVVIAGHAGAVARAIERAREAGARRGMMLPLSVPVHCALMEPASVRFAERLAATPLAPPSRPVIGNVDVLPHDGADMIRTNLGKQLFSPVRWTETIEYMASHGVRRIVECGPGRVLTGLNRRIARDVGVFPAFDPPSLRAAVAGVGT